MSDLRKFESGATRSSDADSERYDLFPAEAYQRMARIMADGAKVHGDSNWKKGIPIEVCINHLERHLVLWKMGDRSEDHLAKVGVNAAFIMYYEERKKMNKELDKMKQNMDITIGELGKLLFNSLNADQKDEFMDKFQSLTQINRDMKLALRVALKRLNDLKKHKPPLPFAVALEIDQTLKDLELLKLIMSPRNENESKREHPGTQNPEVSE